MEPAHVVSLSAAPPGTQTFGGDGGPAKQQRKLKLRSAARHVRACLKQALFTS